MNSFLIATNVILIALAIYLILQKRFISFLQGGHWWITWLAIGVITLMDELSSIFYAPAEAFRYIGIMAIFFIPLTAIIIHYMTTRMVEIAEILDVNNLKGGGVYNFSYLVLGPVISFVAVASIMVDYLLTGAISSVSAIENLASFSALGGFGKIIIEIAVIWAVAGLNIMGIRDNARFTFGIFLVTAVILINLVISGIFQFSPESFGIMGDAFRQSASRLTDHGFFNGYYFFIGSISSCILAYSGVESVLQTASLVRDWKVVKKAYIFLALSVGIFTPFISVLILSRPGIDFAAHEGDLITYVAGTLNGPAFGMTVGIMASVVLLMAVNTAFVASSELVERIAHRYGFHWIVRTNKRASLYRIHIASAIFFTGIILVTQGQQKMLAEMYAVGLVASFAINLLSLIIYRYSKGTKEVKAFHVSRIGTILFFLLIFSCFLYLAYHKPAGFSLWAAVTAFYILIGIYGARKRAPEIKAIATSETPMDIVLYVAESEDPNVQVYFKRPADVTTQKLYGLPVFITMYSPRQEIPPRLGNDYFRIPFKRAGIFQNIMAILDLLAYELPHKNITVHFGWPTSSWIDRLSTGVMVFQFMRLPKVFSNINFRIEAFKK